ncbi:exodeoxyribonuclease VII small subunit [Arenicella xantha]|uniref:Exodeoxyribonuclease 7 small subunit n=1 Tax=Arenicella xantha TaxID=644221 RepID=A0A395JEZ6_9GAMM|nr:exodeoxyribonuclease VII small subunit [Arenicella xantha]RBP48295.1 exodeoxyribonuclease VII small subunit [Arenicella xantha]
MADTELKELDFEHAYQELEAIVDRMERGEQSLEQSLSDFERGVVLMKHCHGVLRDAEQKVEILVKDNNGLFSTEPFDERND